MGALATNWQSVANWSGGDFNGDGLVDVSDLGILATNWQAGASATRGATSFEAAWASVPEPASAVVLCVITVALGARRRLCSGLFVLCTLHATTALVAVHPTTFVENFCCFLTTRS